MEEICLVIDHSQALGYMVIKKYLMRVKETAQ